MFPIRVNIISRLILLCLPVGLIPL